MKSRIISAVCGSVMLAASGAAFAADMPVKAAPRLSPMPLYNWTGWYAGGNVGYGWGEAKTDSQFAGSNVSGSDPLFITNDFSAAGSHKQKLHGIIGGGQIGYNVQYSRSVVFGFEADFQAVGHSRGDMFNDALSGGVCDNFTVVDGNTSCTNRVPLVGSLSTALESKIDWFGTVRGRVGWLVTDKTLLYATGGLAYGRVSVSGSTNISGSITSNVTDTFGPGSGTFGASKTKYGFAVGGGIEDAAWLPPGWTWKLEYLYVDLGSLNVSTPLTATSSAPGFVTDLAGTASFRTRFVENIARVGLNYRFGP